MGGIFGGGGGSSSSSSNTTTSNTTVNVSNQVNSSVEIPTQPIAEAMDRLMSASRETADKAAMAQVLSAKVQAQAAQTAVDQVTKSLSDGEKMRLALAAISAGAAVYTAVSKK